MEDKTVFSLFAEATKRDPGKTAIVYRDEETSYGELYRQIMTLGRAMLAHGIRKGTRIATLMRNRPEFIALLYAAHVTGAVIVPMNFRNNPRELARELDYSECEWLFYENALTELAESTTALAEGQVRLCAVGGAARENEESLEEFSSRGAEQSAAELAAPDADDWALMLFSGGTTGASKLAVHTHGGLYSWVTEKKDAPRQALAQDVFLMSPPMCHSAGMGMLHDMLSCGATLVISEKFEPEYVLELITKWRVTQMFLIPPTLCRWLDAVCNDSHRLDSVRIITLSGGTIGTDVIETCYRLFANAKLCMVYSQSERAVFTMQVLDRATYAEKPYLARSVGKPYIGCELRLVDENGDEVTQGMPGEAWAHSKAGMVGYLKNEERYIDGWLNTGDVLRMDEDGNYFFLSRKKECIKTGGENVFATEVEQVISCCDGVAECAVFGLEDELYKEAVCAAIIPKGVVRGEDVIAKCREMLSGYKKPRKIYFVESFPKTAVGKTDKRRLALTLAERKPDYEIK